jgi:hypothetical protein
MVSLLLPGKTRGKIGAFAGVAGRQVERINQAPACVPF